MLNMNLLTQLQNAAAIIYPGAGLITLFSGETYIHLPEFMYCYRLSTVFVTLVLNVC